MNVFFLYSMPFLNSNYWKSLNTIIWEANNESAVLRNLEDRLQFQIFKCVI